MDRAVPPVADAPPVPRSRWRRDLLVVAGLTAIAAVLSVHLELAEILARQYRPEEGWELDEAPGVLLVLALGLAWYAWRRFGEARAALARSLQAEQQLAEALAGNRRLVRQYADLQETERTSLSRELHDELGQYLNAIKIDAVALRHAGGEAAESIVRHVDHVQGVVARMIRHLRPVGLDELGLEAALEHCLDTWRGRLPAVVLSLDCRGPLPVLGEAQNMAIFRLVQEGLTNAFKHAEASRVAVRLGGAGSEAGDVVVEVIDDGRGMAPQPTGMPGLGLIGMRERIEALRGEFRVDSAPGLGCRLWARLPAGVPPEAPTHA